MKNPDEHFSKWSYCTIIEALTEESDFKTIKEFKSSLSKPELHEKISQFADKNKSQVFRTAAVGGGALKKRKQTVAKSKKSNGNSHATFQVKT
ncbi:MAG: hypothetical protein BalsKO_01990 [Balneolaceae bacterium]